MKTIIETLTDVIRHDSALHGFRPNDLPTAAKARIQNTLVSLDRHLSDEELATLENWTGGDAIFAQAEAKFRDGQCCYYVYPDGSLYFCSSGESEVWVFASDFANERIINGYDGPVDTIDAELLQHLGGYYADVVTERAKPMTL